MTLQIFIPAAPVPKGSSKMNYSFAKKRLIVAPDNGAKQAAFKNTAMPYFNQLMAGRKKLTGAVAVRATFYIQRPESVTRRLPCVKPDLDKYLRMLLDTCTERVWVDDGQVVKIDAVKEYATAQQPCGVDLKISEVEQ